MKRAVVVMEDEAIAREGIRVLLRELAWIRIDCEFLVRAGDADLRRLCADLAVIDVATESDLQNLTDVRTLSPSTRILALVAGDDQESVRPALRAGAHGVLARTAARAEFEIAVRRTLNGSAYVPPSMVGALIAGDLGDGAGFQGGNRAAELTPREREILSLIAHGERTRSIAQQLSISVKTVETHRANLMRKLDLHSVADVTSFAIREGYFSGSGAWLLLTIFL